MTTEQAPDPKNVRDALLEAGYSPEEVEAMLRAVDRRFKEATQRLLDSARSQMSEPFVVHGIGFAGELRACQECGVGPMDNEHEDGCSIKLALGVLGLHPIRNRAQLLEASKGDV